MGQERAQSADLACQALGASAEALSAATQTISLATIGSYIGDTSSPGLYPRVDADTGAGRLAVVAALRPGADWPPTAMLDRLIHYSEILSTKGTQA